MVAYLSYENLEHCFQGSLLEGTPLCQCIKVQSLITSFVDSGGDLEMF